MMIGLKNNQILRNKDICKNKYLQQMTECWDYDDWSKNNQILSKINIFIKYISWTTAPFISLVCLILCDSINDSCCTIHVPRTRGPRRFKYSFICVHGSIGLQSNIFGIYCLLELFATTIYYKHIWYIFHIRYRTDIVYNIYNNNAAISDISHLLCAYGNV